MKKSSLVLLIVLLPMLIFAKGTNSAKNPDKEYVDNLTEEEIVKGNRYTKSSSVQKTSNNKTSLKVKRFSGIEEIFVFAPKNENVEITLSSTVEAGALRLVVCDKENVLYEFEVGEENQTYKLPATKGRYILKAVGSNARYTVEVSCTREKSEIPTFKGTVL